MPCPIYTGLAIYLGAWDLWLTSLLEASDVRGSTCRTAYKHRVFRLAYRYDRLDHVIANEM